jgi:hypothetical protein
MADRDSGGLSLGQRIPNFYKNYNQKLKKVYHGIEKGVWCDETRKHCSHEEVEVVEGNPNVVTTSLALVKGVKYCPD